MNQIALHLSQDVRAGLFQPKALFFGGFLLLVGLFLALDLGVFNRKAHKVSLREAMVWTAVWVSAALAFCVAVYFIYQNHWLGIGLAVPQSGEETARTVRGAEAASLFLVCWMLEYALSLDNIFVIALIFAYFRVPERNQHRVLFWGILGAVVLRGAMIGVGVVLIREWHWVIYLLAGFLVFAGIKMVSHRDEQVDPSHNPVVRLAHRFLPLSQAFEGDRFFLVRDGRMMMTPLFLVLLVVETTDVVFAVDSIPAAFGVTQDGFIVFTSNIFAILGLRSLYFALSAFLGRFEHLKYSLAFILVFIGAKMLLPLADAVLARLGRGDLLPGGILHLPHWVSLSVIGGALLVGVVSSLVATRNEKAPARDEPGP